MNTRLETQVNAMDELSQIKWLLSLEKKTDYTIYLDNDNTNVFHHDTDILIDLKADLGNRAGVSLLLIPRLNH